MTRPRFPHRLNPDGSIDSICTRCYRTVASAASAARLGPAESAHHCDPHRLDELRRHLTAGMVLLPLVPGRMASLRA